uniref:Dynein regulatory complex subunit 7 MORN domain-containing protein n=1 Tax=Poecilia mexicana TaxID=48701 RepID=A0A3B3YL43_9TELE
MEAGGKFVFDDEFQEMEKKMTLSQEPEEEEEEDVSDDLNLHRFLLCQKLKVFYEVSESRPLLSVCSPESYKTNSQKEEHLLEIAENFQRQYLLLHPDRKPLLLYPVNEYGVRKFVSTTLRPTETGLWDQSVRSGPLVHVLSVSDRPAVDRALQPTQLFSPTAVLRSQEATSFESSTLLCSLLLGLNYDAYVVSGYAVREMCLLDLRLQQCPLLDTKAKAGLPHTHTAQTSRFLIGFVSAERPRRNLGPQEKSTNLPDPLQGFRVHCWVLVLSGRRSIEENFFIDPLTGCSYPTVHDSFQGIESLWNPFNYYVNRQDCSSGCKDMKFDLENSTEWEPVLHDGVSQQQLIQAVHRRMENRFIGRPTSELEVRTTPVCLSVFQIHKYFIDPKKITSPKIYCEKRQKRFTLSHPPSSLILRLFMLKAQRSPGSKSVHAWKPVDSGTEREMRFHRPEQDGLERIVVSPQAIEQSFKYRDDFLYLRQIFFREGGMIPPPYSAENGQETTLENLNVLKVVERFHRNPSKPVNEDVAQRVFLVPEMKTELLYHLMDHRTIPSRKSLKRIEDDEPITDSMFSFFLVRLNLQLRPFLRPLPVSPVHDAMTDSCLLLQELTSKEEALILHRLGMDVMVPYLARLGNSESLTPEEATSFCLGCSEAFKEKLKRHTDFLQRNLETVRQSSACRPTPACLHQWSPKWVLEARHPACFILSLVQHTWIQ